MTEPISAEAVEAAARELHDWLCDEFCEYGTCSVHDHWAEWEHAASKALTAAAPLIAARERTTAGAMTEPFKTEHEKNRDLRAGIEAVRDEWRVAGDGNNSEGRAFRHCAAALDALLRGAKP